MQQVSDYKSAASLDHKYNRARECSREVGAVVASRESYVTSTGPRSSSGRGTPASRRFVYARPQMKAPRAPSEVAALMPFQTPVNPNPKNTANSRVRGGIRITVRMRVTISVLVPRPLPWNMVEVGTATAIAGTKGAVIRRKRTRSGVMRADSPNHVKTSDARLGLVHSRAGDLDVTLNRNGDRRSSPVEVAFPGAPNLFVSVDLLEAGFIPAELTTPAKWSLQITNAGERGTVEYFEIHIAARTSPIDSDSDGDDLNDTEETNPGDDGWITDPWRVDTDGDFISDSLEVQGWSRSETAIVADLAGFRTDPNRDDTDRDGFADNEDLDPLHDLMIRLSLGNYQVVDGDPDLDDVFFDPGFCPFPFICNHPFPEPFIEVAYKGKSFFTPHEDPAGTSVNFGKAYTLDVPDDKDIVTFRLRAWDDDQVVVVGNDKQWDISPTISCDHIVAFLLSKGSDEVTTSGEGVDGGGRCRADKFLGDNANFDAQLTYVIETMRVGRINTVLVDSRDVEDLIETADGRHRYLGDSSFYVAWIHVTSNAKPFVTGLNAILVPRAQFFNSSLNDTLQTSSPTNLPAYLQGLTFTAFDEAAEETTNAIVGVLNGRLTGAESSALLQDLLRGADGSTNGDFTVVTDELVTLGLPDRVLHAIPLEGIRFDPQGAGPGTFFDDFIEAFLNAVDFVVQGIVLIGTAIAAFFEEAVAFLG